MASIILENASLGFPLYGVDSFSLKKKLLKMVTGGAIHKHADATYISALSNISLNLGDGDRLALVGHNGAGKTTLLKVISGIYPIDNGRLITEGSIMPMFDMSLGIDMEASGFENIFIRGLMLGFKEKEIKQRLDEIVEFSALGDYLYLPVKMYSQGMLLRLAFSISTCIRADILLFDEWIGVGDEDFRARAEVRLNALVEQAGVIVLASHDDELLKRLCNKALWLEHGAIIKQGSVEDVIAAYKQAKNAA